jgi:hypothetical protein
MNTILIMNCTEIKNNKERPVKLTVGSVKHDCYKQLVVTNALREYLRQVMVGWRFLKRYGIEKKAAYSGNFSEHIPNTSALQT